MFRNWIDITTPISEEMMVYKNKEEKKTKINTRATHAVNGYHESSISMDLHAGTHIDMPLHMIAGGENSSTFDLDKVNGFCVVIDFSQETGTAIDDVFLKAHLIATGDIVLLKTKNSFANSFDVNYDYLDERGAAYLRDLGVKAVGIDALGIERSAPGHPTHNILLGNGIFIIEGLKLDHVEPGRYEMLCLPLRIEGVEGLPARVMLRAF